MEAESYLLAGRCGAAGAAAASCHGNGHQARHSRRANLFAQLHFVFLRFFMLYSFSPAALAANSLLDFPRAVNREQIKNSKFLSSTNFWEVKIFLFYKRASSHSSHVFYSHCTNLINFRWFFCAFVAFIIILPSGFVKTQNSEIL